MRDTRKMLLLAMALLAAQANAQKVVEVHGKGTYVVGENDNITLTEAKLRCIEWAKTDAIEQAFGKSITSNIIDTNMSSTGAEGTVESSYFWMNTEAMSRGDWLGDTREPEINVEYIKGELFFTAEVWGKAREITRAKTNLKWSILKDVEGRQIESTEFSSGERFFVRFRSPADGYVAAYLIQSNSSEATCLVPYKTDTTGRFEVKGGREITFFDKTATPAAPYYINLTTDQAFEMDGIVIIYSPNPFTKCDDTTGDARHLNFLGARDFRSWLRKSQQADREMVVETRWVKITNDKASIMDN
ncbi:MAG: DUF4384 domain-containing protein [Bacteroidaceae bacterium]|nr:DUF4384 domain-containing protein [Bacteroidaceae bacterium]